jgi:hypothetical protein
MNNLNDWVLKDQIKRGLFTYNKGDEVSILRRKSNGHPRSIKDDKIYIVRDVHSDGHLTVAEHSLDGIGFLQSIRVHKMYMMNKSLLREIKLNSLFDETK